MKLRPETESRNSVDHKLWNHKMQGSPVYTNYFVNAELCCGPTQTFGHRVKARQKYVEKQDQSN